MKAENTAKTKKSKLIIGFVVVLAFSLVWVSFTAVAVIDDDEKFVKVDLAEIGFDVSLPDSSLNTTASSEQIADFHTETLTQVESSSPGDSVVAVSHETFIPVATPYEADSTVKTTSEATDSNIKKSAPLVKGSFEGKGSGTTYIQVSWELENIEVTITDNMIWDADNLDWVGDSETPHSVSVTQAKAKFTFVNFTSDAVEAQVKFDVADNFTPITPVFVDNGSENGTGKILLAGKTEGQESDNEGVIALTLTPVAEDFKNHDKTEADLKYGIYTVSIGPDSTQLP